MTNDVKRTVETYHNQMNLAATEEERQQLATAHQTFIDQLTPEQQTLARDVVRPYLLNAIALAAQMEPVLQRAKDKLNHRREPA